jgi:putative SOS response-associated peptidase YedK
MCNLYRLDKSAGEVAKLFKGMEGGSSHAPVEIYPGYPGLVVASGELRSMVWGFPLVLKGKSGQPLKPKPCNNTRVDRLDSFMWRYSFEERRCLIRVAQFAWAEAEKGAKTRTWISLADQPLFAPVGISARHAGVGPAYSMMMTQACVHVAGVHHRMAMVLRQDDGSRWTDAVAEEARVCASHVLARCSSSRPGEPCVGS